MSVQKPRIVGFHAAPHAGFSDERAEILGRELLRIERECGDLEIDTLLDDAKRRASPLHDEFTWDDEEAAEKCRRYEAGELRRSIEVDVKIGDATKERMPLVQVFTIEIREPGGSRKERHVGSIVTVLTDPAKAKSAVAECKAAFVAVSHRFDQMRDAADESLCSVFVAVGKMEQQMAQQG